MLLEFVFCFDLVIGMCPMNAIACLAVGWGGVGGVCLFCKRKKKENGGRFFNSLCPDLMLFKMTVLLCFCFLFLFYVE